MDALVYAGVALGAAVEVGCSRLRARLDPELAATRRRRVWDRNAEFCAYIGLDPVAMLGPAPEPEPVAERAWSMPARPAASPRSPSGTITFAA
jgi:hypothetical protein